LFKSNFRHDLPYPDWLESHARLIADIRAAAGRERMFIAIDHEGGRVCRTPPPITRFAAAANWAGRPAEVGRAMGRELSSLGINLTFSPLLDIQTNPQNPVIGERAFGQTARAVIEAAVPFIAAIESEKIIACGKHFPGHGDTDIDSHLGLPSQPFGIEALRARELKPFAAAILREELGFEGVIVSDDIGMGAMKTFFESPEAAVRLIKAGCDMLMICAHFTETGRAKDFARAIVRAAREGRLDAGQLARSRQRIERLLSRAATHPVTRLPEGVLRAHANAAPLFGSETAEIV
jgi:beta-N-acetylhexosaminidase